MKKYFIFCLAAAMVFCGCTPKGTEVVIETDKGDIELVLYDDTPLHRDNFIKLLNENYFDGVLFHRVIKNFMIQSGDPDSRGAAPGVMLGEGGPDYTVPAEFRFPKRFHKKGVLAAAREGDEVNPERASAASQFYIVWGRVFDDEGLDKIQRERLDKATDGKVKLTPEIREVYKTIGGTPHLDGQYTVFGEVLSGMDVVNAIQNVDTDENDRPIEDIHIIRAYIK